MPREIKLVNIKDILNNRKFRTKLFGFVLILVLILLFGRVILNSQPLKIADLYSKEDGIIENVTLLFGFLSSVLFVASGVVCKKKAKSRILLLIGLTFFIFIGEELSWGGRFFHWKYPVLYGVPINGVHDILFVARDLMFKRRRSLYLRFTVLGSSFLLLIIFYRRFLKGALNEILSSSGLRFIVLAVISILISLIFDLHLIDNRIWNNWHLYFLLPRYIEESFELIASMSFMFAGIESFIESKFPAPLGDNN